MMRLLYKEFRLSAHPTLYIFIFMGALILIPEYPYCMVFFFGCLAPFITLYNGRENHDAFYTASLPGFYCVCSRHSNTYLCKKSCSDPCSDSCSWICSPICLVFSLKTVEVSCGACSAPGVCMFSFLFSQEPSRLSSRKGTFRITDTLVMV